MMVGKRSDWGGPDANGISWREIILLAGDQLILLGGRGEGNMRSLARTLSISL